MSSHLFTHLARVKRRLSSWRAVTHLRCVIASIMSPVRFIISRCAAVCNGYADAGISADWMCERVLYAEPNHMSVRWMQGPHQVRALRLCTRCARKQCNGSFVWHARQEAGGGRTARTSQIQFLKEWKCVPSFPGMHNFSPVAVLLWSKKTDPNILLLPSPGPYCFTPLIY